MRLSTTMEYNGYQLFMRTMNGLKDSFQVQHIATFGLVTCKPDDDIQQVLASFPEFDQIPVREGDRLVGVLERTADCQHQRVGDALRSLDDSILVADSEPLAQFISVLVTPPYYRLVVQGVRINGIVTRSDALKLPVRLLAFASVTQVEMSMASAIQSRYGDGEEWINLLSKTRRDKLSEKAGRLRTDRSDPAMLELTDFCDKRDIVRRVWSLDNSFEREMRDIEELRNKVAHAGNYAPTLDELREFLRCLMLAETWIKQLNELLLS